MTLDIDSFLNRITMYLLTQYVLIGFLTIAIFFSAFGILAYDPLQILFSALFIIVVTVSVNYLFANLFHAVYNIESSLITGLILSLISPVNFPQNIFFLAVAGAFAAASKYLLTINKQHLFNPAAVAVTGAALLLDNAATWWIGTSVMVPFIIIGGFLIVRKTGRESMVLTFLAVYFILTSFFFLFRDGSFADLLTIWKIVFINSAVFYFATVMLMEPHTAPGRKNPGWRMPVLSLFFTPVRK